MVHLPSRNIFLITTFTWIVILSNIVGSPSPQIVPSYRRRCSDPHADFTSCGRCQRMCINNRIEEFCPSALRVCVAGCFCEEGYVWASEIQSRCIPIDYCTTTSYTSIQQNEITEEAMEASGEEPSAPDENVRYCADPNAEYLECGYCSSTCEHGYMESCSVTCRPGCFCKDGFLKSKAHSDQCIPKEQCVAYVGRSPPNEQDDDGSGSGAEPPQLTVFGAKRRRSAVPILDAAIA